jgi:hypothetical protein
LPGMWMCPGMMPILQPRGSMIPGQLGPAKATAGGSLISMSRRSKRPRDEREGSSRRTDHARLGLRLKGVHHLDLVKLGDALGDGDDETDLGLDGLKDGVGSARGRNVDNGGVGLGLPDGLRASSAETRVRGWSTLS